MPTPPWHRSSIWRGEREDIRLSFRDGALAPDLRCAIAHRGILGFRARCFGSPRNDAMSPLRWGRLFGLRFDLADRVDDGIKGQHGRGMPGLVIAHRLEQRDVSPLALWRAAVFLQHP